MFIPADNMSPGFLSELKIEPLVFTVQLISQLYVEFTTEHALYDKARIIIIPPPGLTLPAVGESITVTPYQGSTRATSAVIGTDADTGAGTIIVDNFVQQAKEDAPLHYKFSLSGIAN